MFFHAQHIPEYPSIPKRTQHGNNKETGVVFPFFKSRNKNKEKNRTANLTWYTAQTVKMSALCEGTRYPADIRIYCVGNRLEFLLPSFDVIVLSNPRELRFFSPILYVALFIRLIDMTWIDLRR